MDSELDRDHEDIMANKKLILDLSNPVQSVREQLGLTHEQIGDATGTTKQTAYGYGVEGNAIRLSTIEKIAAGLGYELQLVLIKQ